MTEESKRFYEARVEQVNELKWKNMESFHSRLITLSTAALGASLSLFAATADRGHLLAYLSWLSFGTTLGLMLVSNFLLKRGLDRHLDGIKFFLEDPGSRSYPDVKSSPYQKALNRIELFASLALVLGIFLTAVLVVQKGT
jgi:hypothetical protein